MRSAVIGATVVLVTLWGCASTAPISTPSAFTLPVDVKWSKLDTVAYRGKQDDIFFVDPQRGWYVNGGGKIYKTTDGGKTWQEKASRPGTYFRTIGFIDARTGFAGNVGIDYYPGVTDATPLYRTDDGGDTWHAVALPQGVAIKGLCAIDVLHLPRNDGGKRTLVHAVGRVGGPAVLLRSLDAGNTWKVIDLSAHAGMVLDVKFFDENTGLVFAASPAADDKPGNALILMTRDGGTTWTKQYQSTRANENVWKASFPTRNVGYATVQNNSGDRSVAQRYVVKTTDGGMTWQELPLVADSAVQQYGIGFVTENVGWVGAVPGGFQTTDGGQTWTRVELGRAVNKIRVLPGEHGFVAYAIGVDVYKLEVGAK